MRDELMCCSLGLNNAFKLRFSVAQFSFHVSCFIAMNLRHQARQGISLLDAKDL